MPPDPTETTSQSVAGIVGPLLTTTTSTVTASSEAEGGLIRQNEEAVYTLSGGGLAERAMQHTHNGMRQAFNGVEVIPCAQTIGATQVATNGGATQQTLNVGVLQCAQTNGMTQQALNGGAMQCIQNNETTRQALTVTQQALNGGAMQCAQTNGATQQTLTVTRQTLNSGAMQCAQTNGSTQQALTVTRQALNGGAMQCAQTNGTTQQSLNGRLMQSVQTSGVLPQPLNSSGVTQQALSNGEGAQSVVVGGVATREANPPTSATPTAVVTPDLYVLSPALLAVFETIGATNQPYPFKQILCLLKNYLYSRKHLFDSQDYLWVNCGNDPLSHALKVSRFHFNHVRDLLYRSVFLYRQGSSEALAASGASISGPQTANGVTNDKAGPTRHNSSSLAPSTHIPSISTNTLTSSQQHPTLALQNSHQNPSLAIQNSQNSLQNPNQNLTPRTFNPAPVPRSVLLSSLNPSTGSFRTTTLPHHSASNINNTAPGPSRGRAPGVSVEIPVPKVPESSSDVESIYSWQGYETEYCRNTEFDYTDDDDDVVEEVYEEYEVVSDNPADDQRYYSDDADSIIEDVEVAVLLYTLAQTSSGEDADNSDSDDQSADDPDLRGSHWHCLGCGLQNTPMVRYCAKCWKIRKDWLPERPRHRKRKPRPKKKKNNQRKRTLSVMSDLEQGSGNEKNMTATSSKALIPPSSESVDITASSKATTSRTLPSQPSKSLPVPSSESVSTATISKSSSQFVDFSTHPMFETLAPSSTSVNFTTTTIPTTISSPSCSTSTNPTTHSLSSASVTFTTPAATSTLSPPLLARLHPSTATASAGTQPALSLVTASPNPTNISAIQSLSSTTTTTSSTTTLASTSILPIASTSTKFLDNSLISPESTPPSTPFNLIEFTHPPSFSDTHPPRPVRSLSTTSSIADSVLDSCELPRTTSNASTVSLGCVSPDRTYALYQTSSQDSGISSSQDFLEEMSTREVSLAGEEKHAALTVKLLSTKRTIMNELKTSAQVDQASSSNSSGSSRKRKSKSPEETKSRKRRRSGVEPDEKLSDIGTKIKELLQNPAGKEWLNSSESRQLLASLSMVEPLPRSVSREVACFAIEELDSSQICTICCLRPKNAAIIHGRVSHQATCFPCANRLRNTDKPCPVCRRKIHMVCKHIVV